MYVCKLLRSWFLTTCLRQPHLGPLPPTIRPRSGLNCSTQYSSVSVAALVLIDICYGTLQAERRAHPRRREVPLHPLHDLGSDRQLPLLDTVRVSYFHLLYILVLILEVC